MTPALMSNFCTLASTASIGPDRPVAGARAYVTFLEMSPVRIWSFHAIQARAAAITRSFLALPLESSDPSSSRTNPFISSTSPREWTTSMSRSK